MKQFIITIILTFISSPIYAVDWDVLKERNNNIPQDFYELSGAFKGKGLESGKTAYLLVYNIMEYGHPSGRYNIYLLSNNRKMGQVFEAELISPNRIGLVSVGLDDSGTHLESYLNDEIKQTLELSLRKNKAMIRLVSNASQSLTESYEFDRVSDDIQISLKAPSGYYNDKRAFNGADNHATFNVHSSESANMVLDIRDLNIANGNYFSLFELSGLLVLRKETVKNTFDAVVESKVTGVAIEIWDKKDKKVILSAFENMGKASPVVILEQK